MITPKYLLILFFFLPMFTIQAQQDIQIGSDLRNLRQSQGAYYDYSDPAGINIRVQLWGFVQHPGYYIVPARTNLSEIITLAGGPTDAAHLNDIRIYRNDEENEYKFLKFDYNDLLWKEDVKEAISNPRINAGDIILVPGSPRFYFKDYLQVGLSIFSALISLTILVLNITK